MKPKVVIFGYTDLVPQTLDLLHQEEIKVTLIVVPRNRKGEEVDLVLKKATGEGIPCLRHNEPDAKHFALALRALEPYLGISASYSHIIQRRIYEIPRRGFVNLHGSLLPRYRGAHTLNWQIINGESEGGVTLHYMDGGVDTGDIIDQVSFPILDDDVAQDVKPRIDQASIQLLRRNLRGILKGSAPRHPQDPAAATSFQPRKPEDGRIDFSWSTYRIYNFIRALAAPYPGAFFDAEGTRHTLNSFRPISSVAALKNRHSKIPCLSPESMTLTPVETQSKERMALSLELEGRKMGKFLFSPLDLGHHRAGVRWKGETLEQTTFSEATRSALEFAREELELKDVDTSGLMS